MQRRKLVERGSFAMTCGAAAVGVPPTVPLFTLAPSFHMRLTPMLCVVFMARFLRFAGICALGGLHWGGGGGGGFGSSPSGSGGGGWSLFQLAWHRAPGVMSAPDVRSTAQVAIALNRSLQQSLRPLAHAMRLANATASAAG